ncbi:cytochrome P450 [Cyathus striatus]|nr:cytochrome P450 [Cyathus striatus]
MILPPPFVLDIFFALIGLCILKSFLISRCATPLPPGPMALPFIGNIFNMPSEREWLTFAEWGRKWGDICSVTILGRPIIILNSATAAFDMLDKKSALYSDRPTLQMGGELVGWKNTLVLLPYGDRFRRYRRLLHKLIGSQAMMKQFYPVIEQETRKFLRRLVPLPDDLVSNIRKTSGAIILRISHGYETKEHEDPFIELANKATAQFAMSTAPGGFLVDVIPFLRHVPQWLPGAGFRRKADTWATTLMEMVEKPHIFVKEQMVAGTALPSFCSVLQEGRQLSDDEEFELKWSAASLYSGGADTTVSAIYSFFLAMTLFPEVARKAQTELDSVVGNDRLPTQSDREYLPYLNALIKEVLRWNAVTPTGIPHLAMQDDMHDGYLIPKGSLIIANIWAMTHDPRIYDKPEVFNPDRFIPSLDGTIEPDPRELCFGFGRRICPGLHLADVSIFITCALTLAVFDIEKKVERGIVIEPLHENTTGTISHPKPFKCSIKPRSERALMLIQGSECA